MRRPQNEFEEVQVTRVKPKRRQEKKHEAPTQHYAVNLKLTVSYPNPQFQQPAVTSQPEEGGLFSKLKNIKEKVSGTKQENTTPKTLTTETKDTKISFRGVTANQYAWNHLTGNAAIDDTLTKKDPIIFIHIISVFWETQIADTINLPKFPRSLFDFLQLSSAQTALTPINTTRKLEVTKVSISDKDPSDAVIDFTITYQGESYPQQISIPIKNLEASNTQLKLDPRNPDIVVDSAQYVMLQNDKEREQRPISHAQIYNYQHPFNYIIRDIEKTEKAIQTEKKQLFELQQAEAEISQQFTDYGTYSVATKSLSKAPSDLVDAKSWLQLRTDWEHELSSIEQQKNELRQQMITFLKKKEEHFQQELEKLAEKSPQTAFDQIDQEISELEQKIIELQQKNQTLKEAHTKTVFELNKKISTAQSELTFNQTSEGSNQWRTAYVNNTVPPQKLTRNTAIEKFTSHKLKLITEKELKAAALLEHRKDIKSFVQSRSALVFWTRRSFYSWPFVGKKWQQEDEQEAVTILRMLTTQLNTSVADKLKSPEETEALNKQLTYLQAQNDFFSRSGHQFYPENRGFSILKSKPDSTDSLKNDTFYLFFSNKQWHCFYKDPNNTVTMTMKMPLSKTKSLPKSQKPENLTKYKMPREIKAAIVSEMRGLITSTSNPLADPVFTPIETHIKDIKTHEEFFELEQQKATLEQGYQEKTEPVISQNNEEVKKLTQEIEQLKQKRNLLTPVGPQDEIEEQKLLQQKRDTKELASKARTAATTVSSSTLAATSVWQKETASDLPGQLMQLTQQFILLGFAVQNFLSSSTSLEGFVENVKILIKEINSLEAPKEIVPPAFRDDIATLPSARETKDEQQLESLGKCSLDFLRKHSFDSLPDYKEFHSALYQEVEHTLPQKTIKLH